MSIVERWSIAGAIAIASLVVSGTLVWAELRDERPVETAQPTGSELATGRVVAKQDQCHFLWPNTDIDVWPGLCQSMESLHL